MKFKILSQMGLNLLALMAGLIEQTTHHVAVGASDKNDSQTVNSMSLKAIESGWLQVPIACKARGFHADPMTLAPEPTRDQVLDIFNSFDQVTA